MQFALYFVLIFGSIIIFHELGHFLVAKMLGIGVKSFSFGFGPRLAAKRVGETEYRLSLLPLGGYVGLVGHDDGSGQDKEKTAEDRNWEEHKWFSNRPPLQRFLVIFGGPFFNLVLAFLVLLGISVSLQKVVAPPVVGKVRDKSPAAEAGIRPGDRILRVGGKEVDTWSEIDVPASHARGEAITVVVQRGGARRSLDVVPAMKTRKNLFGEKVSHGVIGVLPTDERIAVEQGPLDHLVAAARKTVAVSELFFLGLYKLITGDLGWKAVAGPVGIGDAIHDKADAGFVNIAFMLALLSINIGFLNLFPVPVLDGGHLFFLLVEIVAGPRVVAAVQPKANLIGASLLIAFVALVTVLDIYRIFA